MKYPSDFGGWGPANESKRLWGGWVITHIWRSSSGASSAKNNRQNQGPFTVFYSPTWYLIERTKRGVYTEAFWQRRANHARVKKKRLPKQILAECDGRGAASLIPDKTAVCWARNLSPTSDLLIGDLSASHRCWHFHMWQAELSKNCEMLKAAPGRKQWQRTKKTTLVWWCKKTFSADLTWFGMTGMPTNRYSGYQPPTNKKKKNLLSIYSYILLFFNVLLWLIWKEMHDFSAFNE